MTEISGIFHNYIFREKEVDANPPLFFVTSLLCRPIQSLRAKAHLPFLKGGVPQAEQAAAFFVSRSETPSLDKGRCLKGGRVHLGDHNPEPSGLRQFKIISYIC